jgi:RimK-like ATP-grasp domain
MKTFYALYNNLYEGVQERIDQLEAACQKLSVHFCLLNEATADFTNLPTPAKGDMLYTIADGVQYLEHLMLNDDVTTFYIKQPALGQKLSSNDLDIILVKNNIPKPKTVYTITKDRTLLQSYVAYLGGFPIVLKIDGSSRGMGTILVSDYPSLYSTVDYLVLQKDVFVMKQFIESKYVSRCRVLGKEVIDSFHYPILKNDFRNASLPFDKLGNRIPFVFNQHIIDDCIKATQLCNLQFSGVDFLIDSSGNHFILEVNFPSGLALNWRDDNFVAEQMVEFLIKKSKTLK